MGCPNRNWRVTAFIRPRDTLCHKDELSTPDETCFAAISSKILPNAFLDIGPIPPKVLNASGSKSQPKSLQGPLHGILTTIGGVSDCDIEGCHPAFYWSYQIVGVVDGKA